MKNLEDDLISQNIESNWSSFPYKLDYMVYKAFKDNPNLFDICIEKDYENDCNRGMYLISKIRLMGNIVKVDYPNLRISEEDLLDSIEFTGNLNKVKYIPTIIDIKGDIRIQYSAGRLNTNIITAHMPRKEAVFLNNKAKYFFLNQSLNEKIPYKKIADNNYKVKI